MRTGRFHPLLLLLPLLIACTPAPAPPHTPSPPPPLPAHILRVYAGQTLGEISPLVYGANHGPWAFVNFELWEEAEAAGITFLRFPGGNWGDENDIHPTHLDEFIAFAHQIGAEPQISVRLRGGTPAQAAALVRYANLEQAYNIRYWSIGNEPELYHAKSGFADYDSERLNREWRAIAIAMRAIDPAILLIGPEITQFTGNPASDPKDAAGKDWMRSFLTANGNLVDVVSIHRYPFPTGMTAAPATPAELLASAAEWEHIIPSLRTVIRESTGKDLPVAITEINSYWSNVSGGETTPDSFYSALWWADVLGRLIRQDVHIVNFFSLQSHPSIGGYGLLARRETRPSYDVYQLYQRFGQHRLDAASGDPALSLFAARRQDNALTLLIINRSEQTAVKTVEIAGLDLAGEAEVWLFDAEHPAAPRSRMPWPPPGPLSLPPYSATLLIIPAALP